MFIAIGTHFSKQVRPERNVLLLTELKRFISNPGYKHCAPDGSEESL